MRWAPDPAAGARSRAGGPSPPLLVFLHGRGSNGEESNANGELFHALERLGDRAPAVVFPSGGEASYWHARAGGD